LSYIPPDRGFRAIPRQFRALPPGPQRFTADVDVIPIGKVNEAYERLLKSDVKYRFSIDMASLRSPA
jgi:hypothetical protein